MRGDDTALHDGPMRGWLRTTAGTAVLVAASVLLLACSGGDDEGGSDDDASTEADPGGGEAGGGEGEVGEPEVRDELLEMMASDQAERTGEAVGSVATDRRRAERLAEIVDEHGWPTFDLVGVEASTAAWVIAQHADFDVEYQREMLELMTAAVEDGGADTSELAYLQDRVAVNSGEPQTYGTQVRCVPGGGVEPATPLVDEAGVDELRAEVDLDPLADYFAEFGAGCEAETGG